MLALTSSEKLLLVRAQVKIFVAKCKANRKPYGLLTWY